MITTWPMCIHPQEMLPWKLLIQSGSVHVKSQIIGIVLSIKEREHKKNYSERGVKKENTKKYSERGVEWKFLCSGCYELTI